MLLETFSFIWPHCLVAAEAWSYGDPSTGNMHVFAFPFGEDLR